MSQKLLNSTYIKELISLLDTENGIEAYLKPAFKIKEKEILENPNISPNPVQLLIPDADSSYDFENSKLIYEAYKNLTVIEATDIRIWTYLTHGPFWGYMRKRSPLEKIAYTEKKKDYILTHWFIKSLNAGNIMKNNISMLWWVSHLTYDSSLKDPYQLTKEAFSLLDYTRHLFNEKIGRVRTFTHTFLEYVIRNEEIFSKNKQDRVRLLMRKCNFLSGYRLLSTRSKDELIGIFNSYREEILKVN